MPRHISKYLKKSRSVTTVDKVLIMNFLWLKLLEPNYRGNKLQVFSNISINDMELIIAIC